MINYARPVLALMLAGAAMPVHAEEAAMAAAGADAGAAGEIVVTGLKFDRTLQVTP